MRLLRQARGACPCRSLLPLGEGEDEGSGSGKCNEMQPNATELKVLPPLATPDKTKRGQCGLTVAHPLRVSGVPNEATLASFPTFG